MEQSCRLPLPQSFQSLPRRLHQRSRSAGSPLLRSFLPLEVSGGGCGDNEFVEDDADDDDAATRLRSSIHREIRMQDGTSKLLHVAQLPTQRMEGAKSLLVSEFRMNALKKELQRRESGATLRALFGSTDAPSSPSSSSSDSLHSLVPCRAVASLSDVRVPLMWGEREHFKRRGLTRRFAVFCLARVGAQVRDSPLAPCVDGASTDVVFDEPFVFKRVSPDFEVLVEIYAQNLDEVSVTMTPSLIRRKLTHVTSSVGRSVGRRLASRMRDEEEDGLSSSSSSSSSSPSFSLIARTTLRLDDADDDVRAHRLDVLDSAASRDSLPLFGHVACRLTVRPSLKVKPAGEGDLLLRGEETTTTTWTPFWCRLVDRHLSCWMTRSAAESGRPPDILVPVNCRGRVELASASQRAPHEQAIVVRREADGAEEDERVVDPLSGASYLPASAIESIFAAPSPESHRVWWAAFQQHLLDQASWGRACDSSPFRAPDGSSSPDPNGSFDLSAGASPFGTLSRGTKPPSLYESVAISSPSSSASSAAPSPRFSRRCRNAPSSSSSCSSSKSTPTTPKATAPGLTAFPALDDDELDRLFLKYTGGGDGDGGGGDFSNPSSPSRRLNAFFPSMTLKPKTKKLPL